MEVYRELVVALEQNIVDGVDASVCAFVVFSFHGEVVDRTEFEQGFVGIIVWVLE